MNRPEELTLAATLEGFKERKASEKFAFLKQVARWLIMLVAVCAPWAYGSVYYSTQFMLVLGLIPVLGIWLLETIQTWKRAQSFPMIGVLVGCGIIYGLIQILPLPEFWAERFLGRQLQIYGEFTGSTADKPRVTLHAQGTWLYIQQLLLALAALMVTSRYFRTSRDIVTLLVVVAINGSIFALVGIIQKVTGENIISFSGGSNYASYVNRNNAAGFLLITLSCAVGLLPIIMSVRKNSGPELLVSREMPYWRQLQQFFNQFMADLDAPKIAALVAVVVIGAGTIGSLSRGGSLGLVVGMIVTFLTYGLCRRPKNLSVLVFPLVCLILVLSAWVGLSEQLLKRWERTEMVEVSEMDARVRNWQSTWPAVSEMGLMGAGLGSYRNVHRLYNRDLENVLFEYPENQYFQTLVEGGWPLLAIFLAAWILMFSSAGLLLSRGQSQISIGLGTMGVFLLSSQATVSLFDFGFYIPANMLNLAILSGMLATQAQTLAGKLKNKNWMRNRTVKYVMPLIVVIMFVGMSSTALNLFYHDKIYQVVRADRGTWDEYQLGLVQTERRISEVERLVDRCKSVAGLNHLGDLWVHRMRLMALEAVRNMPEYRNAMLLADEKEKSLLEQEAWVSTTPERLRDYLLYLNRDVSILQARAFANEAFFQENLSPADEAFSASRSWAPLQPLVHVKLGQLNGLKNDPQADRRGAIEVNHAVELAPGNPDLLFLAGMYHLQDGNLEEASDHLRRHLSLKPRSLNVVMRILLGETGYNSIPVSRELILTQIIPDDPMLLFRFAKEWCSNRISTRDQALSKAEQLLPQLQSTQQTKLALQADIQLLRDDQDAAIETMLAIIRGNPLDDRTRFRLANLLLQKGRLEEALEESKNLVRSNRTNKSYTGLLQKVETEIRKQEDADFPLNLK